MSPLIAASLLVLGAPPPALLGQRIAVAVHTTSSEQAGRSLEALVGAALESQLGAVVVEQAQLRALRAAMERGSLQGSEVPGLITTQDADLVLVADLQLERNEQSALLSLEAFTAVIGFRIFTTDTGEQLQSGSVIAAAPGRSSRLAAERGTLIAAADRVAEELSSGLSQRSQAAARVELRVLTSGRSGRLAEEELAGLLGAVRALPSIEALRVVRREPAEVLIDLRSPLDTERLAVALDEAPEGSLVVDRYGPRSLTVRYLPEKTGRLRIRATVSSVLGPKAAEPLLAEVIRGGLGALPYVRIVDGEAPARLTIRVDGTERTARVSARLLLRGEEILQLGQTCEGGASVGVIAHCADEVASALAERIDILRSEGRLGLELPALGSVSVGSLTAPGLFPSLSAHFVEHPVGTLEIENRGDAPVDVVVSARMGAFAPELRASESVRIPAQGRADVPVVLELDPERLWSVESPQTVGMELLVDVADSLGRSRVRARRSVVVYDRNSLDWARDGGEAVVTFVNGRSAAMAELADAVRSALPVDVDEALAVAVAMVEALSSLRYIEDPLHPFAPDRFDYLRFPEETLEAGGGDCDDLTVLFASLAEALGRRTLIVLTPSHILPAIELRVSLEQAELLVPDDALILEHRGRVWLPIEATRLRDGFGVATKAAREELARARGDPRTTWFSVGEARSRYPAADGKHETHRIPSVSGEAVLATLSELKFERRTRLRAEIGRARERQDLPGLNAAGVKLARLGENQDALRVFEEVLSYGPFLPARNNLGASLIVETRAEEALPMLLAALDAAPETPEPRLNAILASLLSGRTGAELDRLMEPVPASQLRQLWRRAVALEGLQDLRAHAYRGADGAWIARLAVVLRRRNVDMRTEGGDLTRSREEEASPQANATVGSASTRSDSMASIVYWLP